MDNRIKTFAVLFSLACATALTACTNDPNSAAYRPAPATSFTISVRQGDTLSEIARRYRVDEEDLVAINVIENSDRLVAGSRLYVPAYGLNRGPRYIEPAPRAQPPQRQATATVAPKKPANAPPVTVAALPPPASGKFLWPVNGRVLSSFGSTVGGARNDGINIAVAAGTPILAAGAGTVTYVGDELKGYGNLLLIQHDDGFVTAYAHAERLIVKRGDRVERGQLVGYTGATGDVTEPQLHFEIRQNLEPVDPSAYLLRLQASDLPSVPAKS